MISLLTPFAAYLPAERLHLSGVLATVAAGIFMGWHAPLVVKARMRLQSQAFWEMVVFLLNGLVFIVIGLQLPSILQSLSGASLLQLSKQALAISTTVVLADRLGIFGCLSAAIAELEIRTREPCPPWRTATIIAWSGMRGVVSLAAAFALPLALNQTPPSPAELHLVSDFLRDFNNARLPRSHVADPDSRSRNSR